MKRQDPFRLDPPRPRDAESRPLDPAARDATAHTVFLPGSA